LLQHHQERHRQVVLEIVDDNGYNRSIYPYENRACKNNYNLEGYALVCNPSLNISPVDIELWFRFYLIGNNYIVRTRNIYYQGITFLQK
jgi:hypothetical protein